MLSFLCFAYFVTKTFINITRTQTHNMGKSRKDRRVKRLDSRKEKIETKEEPVVQIQKNSNEKSYSNVFQKIYETKYKQLAIIPFALLLIAFVVIGMNVVNTGDFMNKAVSLKGGVTLTIPSDVYVDTNELDSFLTSQYPDADVIVRELSDFGTQIGIIVEASDISEDELIAVTGQKVSLGDDYSVETLGPSLGASFFKQTMIAIILAFIFMGLVVFGYFRTFVPSLAVILAAFSDIVITLAIVDLMGMRIGAAGIAAFLMLIGYSVDTDILLSTRVIKRQEGTIMQRVYSAMRTGLTMNLTTIAAVTVGLLVSDSAIISQIMTIILIGLIVDIINTWIQNVFILRYYLEKKGQK